MKKTIKKIHTPVRDDIGDLVTKRAMPTESLQHIDPFLFLNHHGHQVYDAQNEGLPFTPHPHRGIETVTFIIKGDIAHKDSAGHESVIKTGGIQWMTAGSGLIHEEVSSEEFKKHGGELEVLQLWLNLPSRLKMTSPRYIGLQENQIPKIKSHGFQIDLISGQYQNTKGPINPHFDVTLMRVDFQKNSSFKYSVPKNHQVFFYLVKGQVEIDSKVVDAPKLVEFNLENSQIEIQAKSDGIFLFGHAEPFGEPIVSYGPFVMNSRAEIMKAIEDFQSGKFQ